MGAIYNFDVSLGMQNNRGTFFLVLIFSFLGKYLRYFASRISNALGAGPPKAIDYFSKDTRQHIYNLLVTWIVFILLFLFFAYWVLRSEMGY